MFDSFFSCSMVLTYSDLAGPYLQGSGSPRPTRYRCTGPAVRRRRGSYRLAENVRGGALMRPSPRALWTTPLRLGAAPGALSFLLTARLVDCPGGWHFAPASFGLLTPRCPFMRSVHQLY